MNGYSEVTDEALMNATGSSGGAALDELYRRYRDELRRYFRRFESPEAEADDLVQETFVRVLRYGASFDPGRSFRGWLFAIARNVGLGVQRLPGRVPLEDAVLSAPPGAEREYRAGEMLDSLERALDCLSASDRRVLVLAKLEGRSYRDVARELGVTEGAVKVRVFRALNRLREVLRSTMDGGGWLDEY